MKTAARRLSAAPIALAATLLTAFLVLFAPLSASAHDSLIASSPEAGSTVETLPAELTLTFSAELIDGPGATEVVVTDASGASVTAGAATVGGAVVTQPLATGGTAGGYHVVWKVVSSDGHPISGEFDFGVSTSTAFEPITTPSPSVAPTSEATETAAPDSGITAEPETEDPSPAVAWIWILAIAGVLVIVGILVWVVLQRRRGGSAAGSEGRTER